MSDSIEDIDEKIAALEKLIADEPRRLRERQEHLQRMEEERLATMPPNDEVINRRREAIHRVDMTHGERNNARREQAKDVFILILCLLAITALGWWVFVALQGA